jgi:dipeptidyl aminopeptidase/acylaminoacyl peptidase
MLRLIVVIAMSTVCSVASLALPSTGHAAFPGRNGALAFAETVHDPLAVALSWRVVSRPPAEGRLVPLVSCTLESPTDCPLHDPAFSPDGRQIAYVAAHADVAGVRRNSLFVAQADGSNPRQVPLAELPPAPVAGAEVIAEQPAWSPDGRQLAFTASFVQPGYPQRFDTRLAEINIDGSYPRRGLCEASQPAWSIVARQRGANIPISLLAYTHRGNVWIARAADCGRPRQLTQHGGSQPTWAPDARRLAFVHRGQIYRVGVNGAGLRRLTRHGGAAPAWSPDGKRIAFTRDDSLYVMTTDGHVLRRVYAAAHQGAAGGLDALAADPDWQPLR